MPNPFQTLVDEAKRKIKQEGLPPSQTVEQGQMAYVPQTTTSQGYTPPEDFDITQPPPAGSTSQIPLYHPPLGFDLSQPPLVGSMSPIPVAGQTPQPIIFQGGAYAPPQPTFTIQQQQMMQQYFYQKLPAPITQTVAKTGVLLPKETPEDFGKHWGIPTGVKEVGASAYDPYYRYAYEKLMGVDVDYTGSKQKLTEELMKSRYWWEKYARFGDDKTFKEIKAEHPYVYLTRDIDTGIFSPTVSFLRYQQEQTQAILGKAKGKGWFAELGAQQIVGMKAFGAVVIKAPFLKPSFYMAEDKGEYIARQEYELQKDIYSGNLKGYLAQTVQSPLITDIALPLTGGFVMGKAMMGVKKIAEGTIKVTSKLFPRLATGVAKTIPYFAKGAVVTAGGIFTVGTGVDIGLTAARQQTGDWVKDWTQPEVMDRVATFGKQVGFGFLGYKSAVDSSMKASIRTIESKTHMVVNPKDPMQSVYVSRTLSKPRVVSMGEISMGKDTVMTKGFTATQRPWLSRLFGTYKFKYYFGKSNVEYITDVSKMTLTAGGGRYIPVKKSFFARFGYKAIKKQITDIFGYSLRKDIYKGETFIKGGFFEQQPEDISYMVSSGRGISKLGKFHFKDVAKISKPDIGGAVDYFGETGGFDYGSLVEIIPKDVFAIPTGAFGKTSHFFLLSAFPEMGRWIEPMYSRKRPSIEELEQGIVGSSYWEAQKPQMKAVGVLTPSATLTGVKTDIATDVKIGTMQGLKPDVKTIVSEALATEVKTAVKTIPIQAQQEITAQIQTPIQLQQQLQLQQQMQLQLPVSLLKTVTIQTTAPPPPFFLFDFLDGGGKPFKKPEAGFNVLIKDRVYVKGKRKYEDRFIKASKHPLSRMDALALGGNAVDNSASATFKIKPTGKMNAKPMKLKITSWNFLKHKFYLKEKNTYIEPSSYRIDTSGEIRGISALGWIAERKRALKPRVSVKPSRVPTDKKVFKTPYPKDLMMKQKVDIVRNVQDLQRKMMRGMKI